MVRNRFCCLVIDSKTVEYNGLFKAPYNTLKIAIFKIILLEVFSDILDRMDEHTIQTKHSACGLVHISEGACDKTFNEHSCYTMGVYKESVNHPLHSPQCYHHTKRHLSHCLSSSLKKGRKESERNRGTSQHCHCHS